MKTKEFHAKNDIFLHHLGYSDIEGFRTKKIAIVLTPEFKNNYNAQHGFILSANLAIRLFMNIDFIIPRDTTANEGCCKNGKIEDYILNLCKKVFSDGNFMIKPTIEDYANYDEILIIGSDRAGKSNCTNAISDGWNVYLNHDVQESNNCNAIGACAAACFGVAEVFKKVVKPKSYKLNDNLVFSLLNYNTSEAQENPLLPHIVDIGDVSLIGAGAIGSAFIYGLNCLPIVKGKLDIVDNDIYSKTNLNRYIIADDTTIGDSKPEIGEKFLSKHKNLRVSKQPVTYNEFIKLKNIDTLISAVDKRTVRYNMQSDLPRLIIDAATTGSAIDLARVDFGTGGVCLGCLYKPTEQENLLRVYMAEHLGLTFERVKELYDTNTGLCEEDIEVISKKLGEDKSYCIGQPVESVYQKEFCGSNNIHDEVSDQTVIAPISFISVLAGIFLVSELIKDRYYARYKLDNTFLIDTLKRPVPELKERKKSSSDCMYCNSEEYLEVYKMKWNKD